MCFPDSCKKSLGASSQKQQQQVSSSGVSDRMNNRNELTFFGNDNNRGGNYDDPSPNRLSSECSDNDDETEEKNDHSSIPNRLLQQSLRNTSSNNGRINSCSSLKSLLLWSLAGSLTAVGMVAFALWFPFALAPYAASQTYDWAYYKYDHNLSHFDNTIWTYGTDYGLAVVMMVLSVAIVATSTSTTRNMAWKSAGLLLSYCVSVLAGGYAHQFYTSLESRNSTSFRIIWTVCVGTVTGASTFMGMIGSELAKQYKPFHSKDSLFARFVPYVPNIFWIVFGAVITAICAHGDFSFQRPACDIFIAGITQSPSTFYVMLIYALVLQQRLEQQQQQQQQQSGKSNSDIVIRSWLRVLGIIGFILNAPLLPMYPLLVQYTDWSLASVNTLLHLWLCVAWSLQGISMRHYMQGVVQLQNKKKI